MKHLELSGVVMFVWDGEFGENVAIVPRAEIRTIELAVSGHQRSDIVQLRMELESAILKIPFEHNLMNVMTRSSTDERIIMMTAKIRATYERVRRSLLSTVDAFVLWRFNKDHDQESPTADLWVASYEHPPDMDPPGSPPT